MSSYILLWRGHVCIVETADLSIRSNLFEIVVAFLSQQSNDVPFTNATIITLSFTGTNSFVAVADAAAVPVKVAESVTVITLICGAIDIACWTDCITYGTKEKRQHCRQISARRFLQCCCCRSCSGRRKRSCKFLNKWSQHFGSFIRCERNRHCMWRDVENSTRISNLHTKLFKFIRETQIDKKAKVQSRNIFDLIADKPLQVIHILDRSFWARLALHLEPLS